MTQVFKVSLNQSNIFVTGLQSHFYQGNWTQTWHNYSDSLIWNQTALTYNGTTMNTSALTSFITNALQTYHGLSSIPFSLLVSVYTVPYVQGHASTSPTPTIQGNLFTPAIDPFTMQTGPFNYPYYPYTQYLNAQSISGSPQVPYSPGVLGTDVALNGLPAQNAVPDYTQPESEVQATGYYPYTMTVNGGLVGVMANGQKIPIPNGYTVHGIPQSYPATQTQQPLATSKAVDDSFGGLVYYVCIYSPVPISFPVGCLGLNGYVQGFLGLDGLVTRCMIATAPSVAAPTVLTPLNEGYTQEFSQQGNSQFLLQWAGNNQTLVDTNQCYTNPGTFQDPDSLEDVSLVTLLKTMYARQYSSLQQLITSNPTLFIAHGEYLLMVFREMMTHRIL